jgi:hypothetical protein
VRPFQEIGNLWTLCPFGFPNVSGSIFSSGFLPEYFTNPPERSDWIRSESQNPKGFSGVESHLSQRTRKIGHPGLCLTAWAPSNSRTNATSKAADRSVRSTRAEKQVPHRAWRPVRNDRNSGTALNSGAGADATRTEALFLIGRLYAALKRRSSTILLARLRLAALDLSLRKTRDERFGVEAGDGGGGSEKVPGLAILFEGGPRGATAASVGIDAEGGAF